MLVYPLRLATREHLRARGRDASSADVYAGGRHVRLELRGVLFGERRSEAGENYSRRCSAPLKVVADGIVRMVPNRFENRLRKRRYHP
jgi:hypothetical protein